MSLIYTVGHSTRSAPEFLELLQAAGVRLLIDVRRYPGSRRLPHYNREALQAWLADAGIGYLHMPELGGRRSADPDSPNTYWRNASFRAYADHLASPEFAAALQRVEGEAASATAAVMCAEAVPWRCHRQLLADVLVARGHEVRHILSRDRADAHALNAAARVGPDGVLTYPADTAQPSLFPRDDR